MSNIIFYKIITIMIFNYKLHSTEGRIIPLYSNKYSSIVSIIYLNIYLVKIIIIKFENLLK